MIRFLIFICTLLCAVKMDAQEVCNPNSFLFEVTNMQPQKYPSQNVLGFYLEIRNDSALVYLPYIGDSHVAVINNEGLNFAEPVKRMKVKTNKKGTAIDMSFNVSHGITNYRFYVTAINGGSGDIEIIPSNADCCSYFGNWENTDKKK